MRDSSTRVKLGAVRLGNVIKDTQILDGILCSKAAFYSTRRTVQAFGPGGGHTGQRVAGGKR